MLNNNNLSGVSNCYVFKSRLQEYAQKAGIQTPVYETIKEGPSHEPSFRSTVILNNVRYESLPGFFNRKAAEQSAAEVALMELAKAGEVDQCFAVPIQETGLCKNLLQEYAQKMNYAIPTYKCEKAGIDSRVSGFKCTAEIGGIQYIGGVAKTKKEAEIKAARTALLAIQTGGSSDKTIGNSQLTVLPSKKREPEVPTVSKEPSQAPKAKRARFKRRFSRKKYPREKADLLQGEIGNLDLLPEPKPLSNLDDVDPLREGGFGPSDREVTNKSQDELLAAESNGKEKPVVEGSTQAATGNDYSKPCVPAEYYRNFYKISSPVFIPSDREVTRKSQDGPLVAESTGKEKLVMDGSTQAATSNGNSKLCVPAEYYRNFYEISSPVFRPSDREVTRKSQDGPLVAESNGKEKLVVDGSTQAATSNGNSKPCVPAEYYRNFYKISSPTGLSGDTDKMTKIEELA